MLKERTWRMQYLQKGSEQKRVPLRRLRVVVSNAPERSRKQRTQNHPLDLATGRSGNFHGSKIRGKWAWTAKGWSEHYGRWGSRGSENYFSSSAWKEKRVIESQEEGKGYRERAIKILVLQVEKSQEKRTWLKMRERLIDGDVTRAEGYGVDFGQEEGYIFFLITWNIS